MHNLQTETDEQLIQLYENGNAAAFDVLLERHQHTLFSYILALVHDEDMANDIFQETFFKVISYIRAHRYTENGKFQAWIMRIARNQIIDTVRHNRPYIDVADETERHRLMNSISLSEDSIEHEMHNNQTISDLERMIDLLPESQQEVVKMRIYDDRPFKEIAEATNCSINTALGRMRYAVINLRKMAVGKDLTLIDN